MATREDPSTTTIIIYNHHAPKLLETHKDRHPILNILPNTLEYNPTPEWPQYLHQNENQYTLIINIHNQRPPLETNNKSKPHSQHLRTLQHTCENQPHTTDTYKSQSQIHKTMASNPKHNG